VILKLTARGSTNTAEAIKSFYTNNNTDLQEVAMCTSICYAGKGRYVTAIVGRETEHLSEQQCVVHREDLGLDDAWENVSVMVDVATLLNSIYNDPCK